MSCEHYDRSQDTDDDDFIVPGSCAVEYSLECKRMGEAQAETAALRDKVQARREEQHQMMLSEVQRIQTQEVRDQCELTVAGALHEIGDQVEVKQEGFGGEVWWMFGEVEGIACDGTYTLATETGSPSGIRENDLRPHVTVTPVYYDYDPAESRGMGRRDGGTWAPPPPPPVAPASPTEMATVVLAIVVICVIAWAFGIDLSSTSPPSAAQSPAKPKVNQQATEDLAEQKRQAIMQLKTAKAQTRVAMVKAKQDAAEMARLNEYKTKIEQAERDINGDETQLGQARQSLDHVSRPRPGSAAARPRTHASACACRFLIVLSVDVGFPSAGARPVRGSWICQDSEPLSSEGRVQSRVSMHMRRDEPPP